MSNQNVHVSLDDPYDLARFVWAQQDSYAGAFSEIKGGLKRSHWMWYVFPQFDGLGSSATSRHYSIKSIPEARMYLRHAILGPRFLECCEALLKVQRSAYEVFGSVDEQKLRSCATLFDHASPSTLVFDRLLAKYFNGERDAATLGLILIAQQRK